METKTYYALAEGDVHGKFRAVGEPIGQLTDRQAKYLVMTGVISATRPENVGGRVEPITGNEPDPATLGRKTR